MKQYFLFFAMSLAFINTVACPICGCGNSNFQVGILPTYSHAFVGVRYSYSHFSSLSTDGTQFSHDYFHTTELWGGYQAGKVQMMIFIPYIQSHKSGDDGVSNSHGLGDVTVLANYKILTASHTRLGSNRMVTQNLFIGGGIKLRTGQSRVDTQDPAFSVGDFSATPGTGSNDFLLNAMHSYLFGNNGLVSNFTYRINMANHQNFQYGNRVYANAAWFHSLPIRTFVIRPSAGLNLATNATNRYLDTKLAGSSGYVLSAMAGLNIQCNKIGLVANGFLPVKQDLFYGQTKFESRASLAMTYSF